MNLYHRIVRNLLFASPELRKEHELEIETKVVRIHGLCKSMNIRQGYKDIELLYPKDSARLKRDFTFAVIKFSVFSILLIGSAFWFLLGQYASAPAMNYNMDLTQLPFGVILIALITMTFNVLDSLTTRLCFKQYPDKELKGELNPLMRRLMLKNPTLAEAIKQVGVLALVMYCLVANGTETLKMFAILLGVVVLNNTYVLLSRAITKQKKITPIEKLRRILHVPPKYAFVMAMAIILSLSFTIYRLAW